MNTFYEIDSSRANFKEYWWGNHVLGVIIGAFIKLFRIRIPMSSDDPNTESTLPFIAENLPPDVGFGFSAIAAELGAHGFLDPVYYVIYDPGTRTTIYWAIYRHESGNYFARIHQRIWQQAQKSNRGTFLMFFTEFTDGTFLVSSSGKPDMDTPAAVRMNRIPWVSNYKLWEQHLALMHQESQRKSISPVRSREDLIAATEKHHVLLRDFNLQRKIFRPRNEAEQAKADAFTAAVAQRQASGIQHPEVMAELDKLQEVKPAWRGTIWVLAGSIFLFFAAGAANWDWKFTLWLIPALLFHETGHWVMMRIFRYRNLRMFFIPFFGAAVIGKNWNVAGWKKALVSLAGPLPGIVVGCGIGIAGIATHNTSIIEAALILVILNGFNLLPILPLDGGHFMQAILFSRNRWLDVGFRVLAIAGLLGLTVLGLGRFLIYLAIPMAMYLPIASKLGKVTDSLRNANLPAPNPNEDLIPPQTAEAIISQVKSELPKNISNKALAQHTLTVFETLNARPPGVLATIALLALYGGTVFLAVVTWGVFVIAKHGKIGDFVKDAVRQPRYAYTCGSSRSWRGEAATNDISPRNLLVATLPHATEVASAYESLTNRLPQTAELTVFGQTLMVTLPASDDKAREDWFNRLQMFSTNAFVAVSNRPVTLTLMCLAPTQTAATNIEQALANNFEAPFGVQLIPPWSAEAKSARFIAYERERTEWCTMNNTLNGIWTNAELKALNSQLLAATKRGALAEVSRLSEQREKMGAELKTTALERFKKDAGFDQELVSLFDQLSHTSYTNRTERAALSHQIGARLGEVTDEKSAAFQNATTSGFVHRNGLIIRISWISMNRANSGVPALAEWLCSQGCAGMRYEFTEISSEWDDGDEM